MKHLLLWEDTPPGRDGVRPVCYSVCFSPDGTQLVAGVGARVHVYQSRQGMLMHTLKAHKDAVYATTYAPDGTRFATAGADKMVVMWSRHAKGLLKFSHTSPISALAFARSSGALASAAEADIGIWSPDKTAVHKVKINDKAITLAWTPDGAALAVGHADGTITIRDRHAEEQVRISRRREKVETKFDPRDRLLSPPYTRTC